MVQTPGATPIPSTILVEFTDRKPGVVPLRPLARFKLPSWTTLYRRFGVRLIWNAAEDDGGERAYVLSRCQRRRWARENGRRNAVAVPRALVF